MAFQIRRKWHQIKAIAESKQEIEDARIQEIMHQHERHLTAVYRINAEREAAWHQEAARLQDLRDDLSRRNEQKHKQWLIERTSIEAEADKIREINQKRIQIWNAANKAREDDCRRRWKIEVAQVVEIRKEVNAENQRRREQWELHRSYHVNRVRAVEKLNSERITFRKAFDREITNREAAAKNAATYLQQIMLKWSEQRDHSTMLLTQARSDFNELRQRYLELKKQFEADRLRIISTASQMQLDDYLRHELIENASISRVGKGGKLKLLNFGIETAADITHHRLENIVGEGFGPQRITALLNWRAQCERGFVFDSTKHIASPDLRNLHAKFQGRRVAAQEGLRSSTAKSDRLRLEATGKMAIFNSEATAAATMLDQANEDLNLARQYSQ